MTAHRDSSVLELRLRLYRPDPPDGAVEAYLAAVRAAEPSALEERARPRRPRRHVLGVATATVALLAVAAAGLGMARQAAVAQPTPPMARVEVPSAPGHPIGELFGGPATTALLDGRGEHVVVSVLCSGDGTMRIRLGPEPPTVLVCQRGGPALAMMASTEVLDRFTLAVAPEPHVRWSLAVGSMALPADRAPS